MIVVVWQSLKMVLKEMSSDLDGVAEVDFNDALGAMVKNSKK